MNVEQKYAKLRKALTELVGVEDDPAMLREMRDVLLIVDGDDEDRRLCCNALDALIETYN